MKVKDLRKYLDELPEDCDEFDVKFSEVENSEDSYIRKNILIASVGVDEGTEDLILGAAGTINTIFKNK